MNLHVSEGYGKFMLSVVGILYDRYACVKNDREYILYKWRKSKFAKYGYGANRKINNYKFFLQKNLENKKLV